MTAQLTQVLYEVRAGAAHLTINRPEQRNALNNLVIAELRQGIARARKDPSVRCLVLSGAGDKAFCAGGDLIEMGSTSDAVEEHEGRGGLAGAFTDLWGLGKPTIARVDGYCLAGGFGLALACDIVVATERSVFGAPEVKVGLWPYMITIPLLRSMPPKTALTIMMTGDQVNAARGAEIGFVTDLVQPDELDCTIAEYVRTFSSVSPQAIALGRSAFYSVVDGDPHGRLAALHAGLGLALTTPDASEGLRAFREKREPHWAATAGQ